MVSAEAESVVPVGEIELPPNGVLVSAHLPGSVWQVVARAGDHINAGDKIIILESMKMETAITAPSAGRVEKILVSPGKIVEAGQALAVFVES